MSDYETKQPSLGPSHERALELLRRDGIAIMRFSELNDDQELWAELADEAAGFAGTAKEWLRKRDEPTAGGGKKAGKRRKKAGQREGGKSGEQVKKSDFIVRSSAIESPEPSPTMLRYALSDQLLGISNAYLGVQAKLTYVDKWYTVPTPDEAERAKSQRWHRDHIDPHIVKVFTYFTDVDASAGAIEYVCGSAPGGPYGDLWVSREEHYPPDGELERQVPPSARVKAEGPAGTVVICDTGGFHRGGFGRRERLTANFTYVSPEALESSRTKRRFEPGEQATGGLSEAARFALD